MVKDLSVLFGGRVLFDRVNFQINDRDRIGLVGPNGAGKTTLFRVITNTHTPDQGDIKRLKGLRLGYLPQEALDVPNKELITWVLDVTPGAAQLKRQIQRCETDLEQETDPDVQTELGQRLSHLYTELDHLDTIYSPHEAERILLGLGFSIDDLHRPLPELSGGWRMRAALARLLFEQPDALLLDEPTNHLDVPSVHWLDEYLARFDRALVLVCHDREFLNRHINRVISLEEEGLATYTGNYDQYLKIREQEERIAEGKAKKQERMVKQAEKFIERFRAKATKARQAQSKLKLLDKMELVETFKKRKTIHFSFPEAPPSGRNVITMEGVSKAFGERRLYHDLNLRALRGERVAIVGPNGSGKTTLLRILAGELEPDAGTVTKGHNVIMSYYAQHHADRLNPHASVLEEVGRALPNAGVGFIRNVCGSFLFSGDDVEKSVGVLSGGEKARVALARLLVAPGNLMLMDEPTNHLDLMSSEVLIDALAKYDGTLIFVSHNHSFVNRLSTKIWSIEEGGIEEFPGNLNDYFFHMQAREDAAAEAEADTPDQMAAAEQKAKHSREARKEARRLEAQRRQKFSGVVAPLKKELKDLENRIERLETRQKEVSALLSDPDVFSDPGRSQPLLKEYDETKTQTEKLLKRWEEAQISLEEAESQLNAKFEDQ